MSIKGLAEGKLAVQILISWIGLILPSKTYIIGNYTNTEGVVLHVH